MSNTSNTRKSFILYFFDFSFFTLVEKSVKFYFLMKASPTCSNQEMNNILKKEVF